MIISRARPRTGIGTFCEGGMVAGFPSDTTGNAVRADIAAFRLIQHERGRVEILVVPGSAWRIEMASAVRGRFLELVGEPLQVDVTMVADLPRTAAGKHVPIVSHVS